MTPSAYSQRYSTPLDITLDSGQGHWHLTSLPPSLHHCFFSLHRGRLAPPSEALPLQLMSIPPHQPHPHCKYYYICVLVIFYCFRAFGVM